MNIFLKLERAVTVVAGLALLAMMLIISADAVMRYVTDRPILGVQEIVIYFLMPATIWLAMADTERVDGHIRVRFLAQRLRPRWSRAVTRFNLLVALGVVIVMTVAVARATNLRWGATLSGAYGLPTGPSWLLLAVGSALFGLRIALNVALSFTGKNRAETVPGSSTNPTEAAL